MAKRNMKESMDNITNIKDSTAALSPEMQLAKEKAKDKDEEFEKIVLSKDGVLGASKQPTPDKPKWSLDESLFDKPVSLNESGFLDDDEVDVDSVLDSVRDGSIDSTTIVDFLSDHETAFEDACEAFDVFADDFDEQCEALNKEDPEDLVNWISEHEMLWTDFCNYIGSELDQFNESLDESLKESFYWLSDSRINILKRLGYSSKEDLAFAENLCEEEGLDLEEIVNTLDDIYKNGKEKAEAFYRDFFVDEDGNPIEIDESLEKIQKAPDVFQWNYDDDEVLEAIKYCEENNIDYTKMTPTDFEDIVIKVNGIYESLEDDRVEYNDQYITKIDPSSFKYDVIEAVNDFKRDTTFREYRSGNYSISFKGVLESCSIALGNYDFYIDRDSVEHARGIGNNNEYLIYCIEDGSTQVYIGYLNITIGIYGGYYIGLKTLDGKKYCFMKIDSRILPKRESFSEDTTKENTGMKFKIRKNINEASDNKVTLFCTFEPYERYGGGGRLKKVRATGTDNLNAISKLVDKMRLYIDSECIEEDEMTFEDVINELEASNGDGCDFIYELKDNQGNVYISDEYEEEYEDVDESLRKDKNMKRYIIEEMNDEITDVDAYNESRDAKLVKRYKSILGLDEDFEITEENLDDWALKHACSLEGANYDRAKAAVLGLKFEGYK